MKAVVQRVLSASVAVEGQTISSIGKGLLVLVGIDRHDTPSDASYIIKKLISAKLFDDDQGGMWKRSVKDIEGEVLCVSQFTLFANFKGSKPDFHESMSTVPGKAFYTSFLDELKKSYLPNRIKDGEFGAMMKVSLENDGPVTVILSSRDKASSASQPNSGTSTPVQSAEEQRERQRQKNAAKEARKEEYERQLAMGRAAGSGGGAKGSTGEESNGNAPPI